ncbi:hypothetical protein LN996_02220 [Arthrobacter sp. AK01]|uniref:hypothetical protein n=1 Tax=Micrococcaceae TaxID=1268 RepID=UPI001E2BC8CC|nr:MULTISPECIES: hypothetical protein [Micrococcaceae]MCD4849621.1 hypothetical protein [Arthrobacter sp. AK01]MCP1410992.1 hypothetical protein [Paenarthrobacter sp. A20]
MNKENRTPIMVVIACGVVAVLVLVFGVSCGGGNDDAAADWQGGFSGTAVAAKLTAADLSVQSGSCSASDTQLVVTGACVFEVKEFGGGWFSFGPPTKRARLAPQQLVRVSLFIQGTRAEQDSGPGKTVDVTFGTSGGQLGIACLAIGACVLQLQEAGG